MYMEEKMKEILEKMWNEYFREECSLIDEEEERALLKKADEAHRVANNLLTKEQLEAIEKYIDIHYEIEGLFIKKAFFKGCKFAASFFFEVGALKKINNIRNCFHAFDISRF